uniref:Peptidylamidoglycolate lyase n=1 Tax=Leptobrachium leishanense TaxID=445787 RepID=A0A8C5WF73_9ANUR
MKRSFWSRMQGKPGLGLCALAAVITLLLVHSCKPQSLQKEHESYYSAQQEESMQLYKLDANWPKNPDLFTGVPYGVAVDPQNSLVYVAQRGDNVSKVLVFTEEGYFKGKWDTDTLEMPHGIFFVSTNKENSIWVTDVGNGINGHSIKKYSPSGNLLTVLGTPGEAGTSLTPLQFDQPAEIFVEKNGDLYIADGDGGLNNRVLKLTDQFWLEWTLGGNGTNPGQFYIPHSVAVDDVGRVWVADRGNKRIQVFDKTSGEPLGLWSTCFTDDGPYSVRYGSPLSGIVHEQKAGDPGTWSPKTEITGNVLAFHEPWLEKVLCRAVLSKPVLGTFNRPDFADHLGELQTESCIH